MPKRHNFMLISMLLLSLFLTACGKAEKNVDPDPESPALVSSTISVQKVSINLNQKNTAELVLIRKFDDDTETQVNLVVTWDADNLSIKDDGGNDIELDFDKDTLLKGEAEITFKDPESDLDVGFKLELVPVENDPVITEISLNKTQLTIDLNTSNSSSVSLVRKFDDETETSELMNFEWVAASNTLVLKDARNVEVQLTYDSSNISSIPVFFNDPIFNIEISIEIILVEAIITDPPIRVTKVEINDHDQTLLEKFDLALSVALTYSNGDVTTNEFDVVKCKSISENIQVSEDCVITGLFPGYASISLEMLNDDEPTLLGSQIEIIARSITQLRLTPSNPAIQIGEVQTLNVIADYDNNTFSDVTTDSTCSILTGADVISLSSSCEITALKIGNAEVTAVLKNGNIVDVVTANILVSDSLVIFSGDYALLDAEYFGGDTNTTMSCIPDYNLGLEDNCEIYAYYPGSYEVTASLNIAGTSTDVVRTVIIIAVPLGDYSQSGLNEFSISVPSNTSDIIYEVSNVMVDEIYKVSLFDESLSPNLQIRILPDLVSFKTCSNAVPSVGGKVSCGVKALGDKIYMHIRPTVFGLNFGINATLKVQTDVDILQFSGPLKTGGGVNVSYLDTYDFTPLNIGVDVLPIDGHVPANIDGSNVSRYLSSFELGMIPEVEGGKFYKVSVKFDTSNYDTQSVKILWYGGIEDGEPGTQCTALQNDTSTNTVSCTFDNEFQNYIFVEVLGNGVDTTAIDGEISYTIGLTQFD